MTCAPNTNTTRKPCGPARVQGTEHLRNHHRFSTHDHTNYLGVDLAHAHTQVKDMDSHISTFCGHTHLFDHVPNPHTHTIKSYKSGSSKNSHKSKHTHTHTSPQLTASPYHLPLAQPCDSIKCPARPNIIDLRVCARAASSRCIPPHPRSNNAAHRNTPHTSKKDLANIPAHATFCLLPHERAHTHTLPSKTQ
jgi:hypothetical protein